MSSRASKSGLEAAEGYLFHPAAEVELAEAADWYDEKRPGLGIELVEAVRANIRQVVQAPRAWPQAGGVRRSLMRRFPYAIVYRLTRDNFVHIIAVAHFKRRPKYWRGR